MVVGEETTPRRDWPLVVRLKSVGLREQKLIHSLTFIQMKVELGSKITVEKSLWGFPM